MKFWLLHSLPGTPLCIDGTKIRVSVRQRNTSGCYRLSEITGLSTSQHIAICFTSVYFGRTERVSANRNRPDRCFTTLVVFTVLVGNNFCPILDKFDIIIVPQFYKFLRIPVFKVNSFEMFSLLQEWFSADMKEKAKSTVSQNNENFPRHV